MALLTGKDCKVLIKAVDLNLTIRQAVPGAAADELDATVFENTGRKFLAGFLEGKLDLSGLWESGTDNSDAVFHDVVDDSTPFPVSVIPEGLTAGKRAFLLKAVNSAYELGSSVGAVTPADAAFIGSGGAKWGQLLMAAAIATTTNGTGFDNPSDAASTKGARFALHLTANTRDAGSVLVKIQDSADGSSWADLSPAVQFASVAAGATTSEIIEIANGTTLRRHVRAVATVTGGTTGSYQIYVVYSRNF